MTDIVVKTGKGLVRGAGGGGVVSFKGVPFAAAPEGELRFLAPVPVEPWDGVREAVGFGVAPPQLPPMPHVPPVWRAGDGLDCLSLNVWSPDLGAAGLPVMVWVYGGMWKVGSSGMPHYDATRLAASGVVVVTFNYRVGFEGFGHLPGVPDNRGLRDQVAALEWVRRNIAGFGGDPDNVTVFGQSAGAASIAFLASKGLFRRTIAQSVPDGCLDPAEGERVTRAVAAAAGVEATRQGFAALPPEAILAVQDTPLPGERAGGTAYGPVLDGDLVTGPPWSSPAPDVDLVCGFTHEESRGFPFAFDPAAVDLALVARSFGLGDDAAAAYRAACADPFGALMSDALVRMPTTRLAEAHARAGGRTWLYDFTWGSAAHGIDVPFVFGDPTSRYAARFIGTPPAPGFAALSDRIRTSWTSFATSGDPGWPRFDLTHRLTHIWDDEPHDVPYPLDASRRIWRDSMA